MLTITPCVDREVAIDRTWQVTVLVKLIVSVTISHLAGSEIQSSGMVHAGCASTSGIHLSRTCMPGSVSSFGWNACVQRTDLGFHMCLEHV